MSSSVIKQQSSGIATETQSGLVSTGTQSFAGNKTFSGTTIAFTGTAVNVSGNVFTPNRPMFSGSFSPYTSNTSNYNPNLVTSFNVGFAVNAGQSRITVPVAGKYFIQAQQLVNTVGTAVYLHIRKNSNTVRYAYSNNDDTYDMNVSAMVDCAANDYIDFYYSGTTTYSWAEPHTGVICYLIG